MTEQDGTDGSDSSSIFRDAVVALGLTAVIAAFVTLMNGFETVKEWVSNGE